MRERTVDQRIAEWRARQHRIWAVMLVGIWVGNLALLLVWCFR